ncbi:hypothetical protein DAPPUDRAFT_248910 [Daphnia pulex]|uniref:Fucosyltransferase n=1 Tax=Daphnia pulex TaxID=6669 RepID=E9GVG1_DAPPU|nr:hypothetical protein DAPPUDRAFT_248910 [Daphnia pulex]|eukprot:EFX76409.1 hypothetical protein DAPPUDRAFT_248910 [Daphnia pulex]
MQILAHDIVAVVYGGAEYIQHAPPHSYIDARKFKPTDLAGFLKILNEDDELYNEHSDGKITTVWSTALKTCHATHFVICVKNCTSRKK